MSDLQATNYILILFIKNISIGVFMSTQKTTNCAKILLTENIPIIHNSIEFCIYLFKILQTTNWNVDLYFVDWKITYTVFICSPHLKTANYISIL